MQVNANEGKFYLTGRSRHCFKNHCYPVNLNNVVIPECLCRESSDFTAFKVAGSPIQAFGDDDFVTLNSHVSSKLSGNKNSIVQATTETQHTLTGQQ